MLGEYKGIYLSVTCEIFNAIVNNVNPDKAVIHLPNITEKAMDLCTGIAYEIYNENESKEESFKEIEFIIDEIMFEIFEEDSEHKQLKECFYGDF